MKNERGQALLEYAVIMPLFLFILMGIIQLSLILSARITLKYASFCAARAALNAEHFDSDHEDVTLTYPANVDYGGDVEKGEATEAALLVLGAIPTVGAGGSIGGPISLPGWGDLKNTSGLRDRLRVNLYGLGTPNPLGDDISALMNSVTSVDSSEYVPVTAVLEYDMELLFPNFSLVILGVLEDGLFGDGTTITLSDSCTLVKARVPEL